MKDIILSYKILGILQIIDLAFLSVVFAGAMAYLIATYQYSVDINTAFIVAKITAIIVSILAIPVCYKLISREINQKII